MIDPRPGSGASGAAAGLLAPVTEVHYGEEALLRLNLAGAAAYPGFVAELEDVAGLPVGYRRCGTLIVARDTDDSAALDDLFRYQQGLGLNVERLRSRELRSLEPALAPTLRGGILASDDHQVDNRALVEALAVACATTGVDFVRDRAVGVDERGIVALQDGGVVEADKVVVAAGAWAHSLGGVGEKLRVRPVKGQLLHLSDRSGRAPFEHNVRGLDAYLLARSDGRVVLGATVEEQGFDVSPTGAGVRTLLRDGHELIPGIDDLDLVEVAVGLRPGSPDNAPLLGALDDRVIAATGHYRNGILLTPVTAAGIAELVATGKVPELLAPFAPDRFTVGIRS